MNISLIFGSLAFLNIFYTSVQSQVWPLSGASVGNTVYINRVLLERKDDGKTWYIHATSGYSALSMFEVVYGPFELRGFGPYSMLIVKIWLYTNSDEKFITITFADVSLARQFYRVLNPHHSPTFPNDFKIKRLTMHKSFENPKLILEDVPKALDIFVLETPTGVDTRARSYVVHNIEGDQEPILIFHSFESELVVDGEAIMLCIVPPNSLKQYRFRIEFENSSTAVQLRQAYTTLKSLGFNFEDDLQAQDLEALPRNTYPSRPPNYLEE